MPRARDLAEQRPAVVGEPVPLEHLADLPGDLAVPVARQVREDVVLDLVGQVAAQHVEQRRTRDVGRAQHLAQVPLAARLRRVELVDLERRHALGEVAAHDHAVRPHVADEVGHDVRGEGGPGRAGRPPTAAGAARSRGAALRAARRAVVRTSALSCGEKSPSLRSVAPRSRSYIAMPYSKIAALTRFRRGWTRCRGAPLLRLVHAHDPVAEVVVLADHVGVHVVAVVVGALPLLRRRGVVPVPRRGVDPRVAHPVPLAVQDVVPDLHVVEDLGQRERRRAEPPGRAVATAQQDQAAADLQAPLDGDDPPDVRRVVGAAGVQDLLAECVQGAPDVLHLGGAQVGVRPVVRRRRGERGGALQQGRHVAQCPSGPQSMPSRGGGHPSGWEVRCITDQRVRSGMTPSPLTYERDADPDVGTTQNRHKEDA